MIKKTIEKAPEEMREMLESVYGYNSGFVRNKKQEELLERIIEAMIKIDRKFFVPENYYLDIALPIGEGQTISQPSTVARMLFLAELKKGDSVLEVGSGSGWNSCLIFFITTEKVVSIDRISSLTEKAKNNAGNLGKMINRKISINFLAENIFDFSENKFDKIIISAGISEEQTGKIKKIAGKLLNSKGILICPRISGKMIIFKKNEKLEKEETKEEYVFVPLLE